MIIFFIFLIGLLIGSFLNVLIDRFSQGQSISGRSHCDHCKKTLSWKDLIPVVSWVILGGRCRYCKKKISVFYPFVELLTGLAFVYVMSRVDPLTGGSDPIKTLVIVISTMGIVAALIVVFFADFKYRIIPDEATVAVVIFSLPMVFFSSSIQDHIFGAVLLFTIIFGLHLVTRGRGMGLGDVKYAPAMGFLLGLKAGFLGLYIAFVLGGIISLLLIIFGKKKMKSKIAFGPFLVAGTVIMLFWGEPVITTIKLFGL